MRFLPFDGPANAVILRRMHDGSRQSPFRIADVTVLPARNLVGGQGVEPKVMKVLCLLAGHAGEVLTRADIIDRVWGVEYGGDESLTRAISLLRKALGDAKAIETISKRGYRLTLPVTEPVVPPLKLPWKIRPAWIAGAVAIVVSGLAGGIWLMTYRSVPPAEAITVMVEPFSSALADSAQAKAIADNLAGDIAAQSLYRVKSVPYSKVSDDTLTYLVKGDLRNDGQLAIQLLDAGSGTHLWTQTYMTKAGQAPSDDVIPVIASELQLPMLKAAKSQLRARPFESLKPWELNLLVTWVPGTEETPGPPSVASFTLQRRALALDPDFAPAHANFAEMLAYHALFDPPSDTPEAARQARMHADKALALAPYDPEVLYHLATYYRFIGDRQRAVALLRRVVTLQPSDLTAQADLDFVAAQCQPDTREAISALNALNARLSAANPARWLVLSHLADLYLGASDFKRAADTAGQSRDIVITTWSSATLAAADAQLGQDAAAIAHEHDGQWTHLDYDVYAARSVPRLCLDGARTSAVQAIFHHLAANIRKTSG